MKPIQIGDTVGDYLVIDIVGSGGSGAVYKIEHVISKRIEAMKLLPPGSLNDSGQVTRFEREIQVQARLHHPNIAALYTAVRYENAIALVMEFVEGESLWRKLEKAPLPIETAVDYATQVLRALSYAHAAGVIHRDVSPGNIIITPDGVAKLTDFGLARGAADIRLSTPGVPLGSPWYMSPEQVKGTAAVDPRTDLYSVGAVLHEMLTGGKLFDAEGAFAVMRAHVEAMPGPPSARNPKVPVALDEVVRKALAKDPAKRFASADEFRLALEDAVARPPAVPSIPKESWQAAIPHLTARLRAFHPSQAAILMALVPTALVAGFCTIRLFPVASHAPVTATKPRVATVSKPAPPQVAQPTQTVQAAPDVPAGAPAPSEVQDTAEQPAGISRPRAQFNAKAVHAARKSANYPIRVTGGELLPANAVPIEASVAPRPIEMVGPCVPKTNMVTPSDPATPALVSSSAPEAMASKPQSSGNRLVHALGKVNPFRRTAKYEPSDSTKTPDNGQQ